MSDRIELSKELRQVLLNSTAIPATSTVNGKTYTIQKPIAAGYKAAVWQVDDEFGRKRALKLAIPQDYEDRSFLQEVSRSGVLEEKDQFGRFARLYDAGVSEIEINGLGKMKFVCFVEEWIPGVTLRNFLIKNEGQVGVSLFIGYVHGVCDALQILRNANLRHDDFHDGNVMLVPSSNGEYGVKVIDLGSLKQLDVPTKKEKDDHRHVVDHLVAIWNEIHRRKALSIHDRRFLADAVPLLRSMLDDEVGIALVDPEQIRTQFTYIYTRSRKLRPEKMVKPSSPFEFISAEHIADDRVLVQIFAKSCPWLDKVAGPVPCLVTGPRGCGKSTIFRWLSLKAHLHKPAAEIEDLKITGVYLSCSSDLQNRLGWIKTEALAKRFEKEIIHYVNLLAARELIQTLEHIAIREDRSTFWGYGQTQEAAVYEFLVRMIGVRQFRLQGVSRLAQAREALELEMFETHTKMLAGLNLASTTAATFLGDLTTLLAEQLPMFREKKLAFLLDDFSVHRIPKDVQIVLNRIIWERRSSHIFKLSSEKYGAVLKDPLDANADLAREMVEIDCGREFIALDDYDSKQKARTFAVDLLSNRLHAAEYVGTAEQLIGHSPKGSLAKEPVRKCKGRHEQQYYGLERLSDLCSGDVAHLLLVYRRIFEAGAVGQHSTETVSMITQHRCVRSVAGELLDAIGAYYPYGPQMHNIAKEFGELVRRILHDGRPLKKGKTHVPTECPRIEIDQDKGSVIEGLTKPQKELALELIRRAVFIDMGPGLSRHGNETTLRWHLRRIYLPAFLAALAKNDAVKEKPYWFLYFLTAPAGACEMVWNKWPKVTDIHSKKRDEHEDVEPTML